MLSLHPLKSSFEAVSLVGIGLLAQLGPLVYHGVSRMNAAPTPASDHPLISVKLVSTRTIPVMPTKTTAIPIQTAGGMPAIVTLCIMVVIGVAITGYYGRKFLYIKGPPRKPSERTPQGDSNGSGPPTPPPDAGAESHATPPPKKRGWPWFWIICIISTLLQLALTWYYWPQIRKATILGTVLSVVATLSSTLLFMVGPITSIFVTIRRRIRKRFIGTKKHLLEYLDHWNTRYPRTTVAVVDILAVLWSSLRLLVSVMVCVLTFYGLRLFVPGLRPSRTSIYGYCITWLINQLTWQYMACIFGPTALIVLFKLRSPHVEEHLDALSDVVAELMEKNRIVEQQLQAFQARALNPPDGSKSGRPTGVQVNNEGINTSTGDEDIKGPFDHQHTQLQQHMSDPPDDLGQLERQDMHTTIAIPGFDLQVESEGGRGLVDQD